MQSSEDQSTGKDEIIKQAKELIANSLLKDCILFLDEKFDDQEWTLIKGRYHTLRREANEGLISREEERVRKTRISKTILEYLEGSASNSNIPSSRSNRLKRIVILSGMILVLIPLVGYLLFSKKEAQKQDVATLDYSGNDVLALCKFPPAFDSSSLYIVITNFKDYTNTNDTECYGRTIEARIDDFANENNLPIRCCYVDFLSPNQSYLANDIRNRVNADLIIWGRLRNTTASCQADGICLNFEASDSLITYAGGEIEGNSDSEYQFDVSVDKLEQGLFSLGGNDFDGWLEYMYNLKIGKHLPDLLFINPDWSDSLKIVTYDSRMHINSKLGLRNKVLSDVDEILEIQPVNPVAIANKAGLQRVKGDLDSAKMTLMSIENMYFDSSSLGILNFERGNIESAEGNCREALHSYLNALKHPHDSAAVLCKMTWCFLGLRDTLSAFKSVNKAISLDPSFLNYYTRSEIKNRYGFFHSALADVDKALSLAPENPGLLNFKVKILGFSLHEYKAAEDFTNQAITLDKNNWTFYLNRGKVRNKLEKWTLALEDFNKVLSINPRAHEAYYYQSEAFLNLGRTKSALEAVNEAIAIGGDSIAAYYLWRAEVYLQTESYLRAVDDCSQAITIKSLPTYLLARSYSYKKLGEYDKAIADCTAAIEQRDDFAPYHLRANIYFNAFQLKLCAKDLGLLIRRAPQLLWKEALGLMISLLILFILSKQIVKYRKKMENELIFGKAKSLLPYIVLTSLGVLGGYFWGSSAGNVSKEHLKTEIAALNNIKIDALNFKKGEFSQVMEGIKVNAVKNEKELKLEIATDLYLIEPLSGSTSYYYSILDKRANNQPAVIFASESISFKSNSNRMTLVHSLPVTKDFFAQLGEYIYVITMEDGRRFSVEFKL